MSTEPIRRLYADDAKTKVRGYRVVCDAPRDPATGRRKQLTATFATYKEARAWLAETRTSIDKGTFVRRERTDLDAFLDSWLASKAMNDLKPATLRSYGDALRPVRAMLGALPLQDVTAEHVERVKAAMLDGSARRVGTKGKPLSPRSVNLALLVLTMALDQAVKRGRVVRNVASLVDRVAGSTSTVGQTWTPQQVATFKALAAEDRLHAAWLLSLCGLRRGEVLGLRWAQDVDLEAGVLHVRQARVLVAGRVIVGTPKTVRGTRDLPLPHDVTAALRGLRRQQATERLAAGPAWEDSGLVVVDALGCPVSPSWYSDTWDRLVRQAGLPRIRLHDARHVSVSNMRALGHPDHLVARWHGHDEAVMRRTYTHVGVEDMRALAGVREEAL